MLGLMQDWPLTVDKILDHSKNWHGHREVVTRSVEGPIVRATYAEIHARAKRVTSVLKDWDVQVGDRIATLAWNTGRHMEAWYGVMGIGAVCHTLNPRLFPEQIAWIADHAGDRALFVDLSFLPIVAAILPRVPSLEHVIVFTDRSHMPADFAPAGEAPNFKGLLCFEDLVEQHHADCAWGGFDEGTAAGLCYTSGTTGDPKGVLYSHRSNFLHTLITLQSDVMGLSQRDVILPVVPMFHANAWGVAFSAPAVGCKIVMPGAKMDGASIHELLETEGVTFSAAVPTVWQMLLTQLQDTGGKLTTLKKVVIGGAACPEHIIRAFHDDYGVEVVHAWGMTETSPVGTLSTMTDQLEDLSFDEQMPWRLKQGRPPMGVELKLTNDAGERLPHDGKSFGNLKVRGPTIAGEYFRGAGGKILDDEGFFDTGDVATIDTHGFMQITDRAKDVVKSGGEWISTIDIENIAAGHPKAALAAVIGVPHPKWDERPILLVKLKEGETATKEEFLLFLRGKIAKWWMPDDVVFVDDIPLGATGKIDKKLIRSKMKDYVLPPPIVLPDPAPEVELTRSQTLAAADGAQAARIYAPEPVEPPQDLEAASAPRAESPEVVAAEVVATDIVAPPLEPIAGELPEGAAPEVAVQEAKAEAVEVVEVKATDAPEGESETDRIIAASLATKAGEGEADKAAPFPLAPLAAVATGAALKPVPEEAFHAKPTLAVEDAPLAMPIAPRRKRKAASGGWAGGLLNLFLLVALVPAALAAAGAAGIKLGQFDQATGFGLLTQDWAPKAAYLSVATGVLGLIVALFAGFGALWKKALLCLAITIATIGVMLGANVMGGRSPPIHDVSTDWKTPLMPSDATLAQRGALSQTIEADPVLAVGSSAFAGRRVAEVNSETCPAARPLVLERSPGDAYEAAKAAVQAAGMALVVDDPADGRLEATDESLWYGLKDDLLVRVRPDTAGARVDLRSVGRAPGADMGRNCARVTDLLAAIKG